MTRLLIDPATDFDDGSTGPVTLTATLLDPYPAAVLGFTVTDATSIVEVPAPTASQAWRLTARRPVTGLDSLGRVTSDPGRIIAERTVYWAPPPAPLAWAALTDVNPATLQPAPGSTALTDAALAALRAQILGGAGAAFDTLKELETALGDDANFAATVTAALAGKATPADITAAIQALALGSASTHSATDFATPASAVGAAAGLAIVFG